MKVRTVFNPRNPGNLSELRGATNPLQRENSKEKINIEFAFDKIKEDYENKINYATNLISDLYRDIMALTVDEISKSIGHEIIDPFADEKKPELDELGKAFKTLVGKLLKYIKTHFLEDQLIRKQSSLGGSHEDQLNELENQISALKREKDKLELVIDTAYVKINHLEKKCQSYIQNERQIRANYENEISKLKSQIKSQTDQLKRLKEENIIYKKPGTAIPREHGALNMATPRTVDEGHNYFSATLTKEGLKQLTQSMDKDRILNLKKKEELADHKRRNDIEKEKELTMKEKDYLICRLKIQVEEREKDLALVKKEYERLQNEMRKMKEKELAIEKSEWDKEILSDKNPNLVEFYKQKFDKKQEENSKLKKQIRKYALNEKKIIVKEKAFELERADYKDRLIYLQERVSKLTKINEDLLKEKSKKGYFDQLLMAAAKNELINKSETSNEQPQESSGKPVIVTENLATTMESFRKSPKVTFDTSVSARAGGFKGFFG